MKKLGPKGMNALWIAHVIFVASWTGLAVGMLTLLILAASATAQTAPGLFHGLLWLDHLAAGSAVGILLTALVFGIWTPWRFFKHRWITVKWVLLVVQTQILGYAIIMPPLQANLALLATSTSAVSSEVFAQNTALMTAVMGLELVLIGFTVAVSKLKPWRTRARA